MAVDVIVRPEGRCITVVGDRGMQLPERLVVDGAELEGVRGGVRFRIGALTPAMAAAAALCAIAVVVVMDGSFVLSSREVPLDVS